VLYVSDMTLYSICSGILSQWSVLRTGVMWWCFGVLVTACVIVKQRLIVSLGQSYF